MVIVGLTGGIASGKTTILSFIKKQKIPTHDSDRCVRNLYNKPTKKLINQLKSIGLKKAVKGRTINKKIIREEVFVKPNKLKKLEKYIHNELHLIRKDFLKKQRNLGKKIVVLDIPLLFEKRLEKFCHYIFLAYSPLYLRKIRALKRNNISPLVLKKIVKLQIPDSVKRKKADFVINTSLGKNDSNKQTLRALKKIKEETSQ